MRGFNKIEYQKRVKDLQVNMQNNNIDLTLITSPHNFRYFTGLDSYFWESPTRPWFLLISQNKNPVAIIPSIGKTALQKTWIKEIKTWPSPQPKDEGVSELKKYISKVLPNKGNIGCELGLESHLRMSINDFDYLRNSLSNLKFIDASIIIWKQRIIKSQNEIKKIKEIILIASKVFDNFQNQINIGMTEIEICKIFKKELINEGADHTLYMSCSSGNGGYDQIICDPSDKIIQKGDIMVIDTGTTLDGYFCDFNRNYGFGSISKESINAYNYLWEATERTLDKLRPGISCAEIYESLFDVLKNTGLQSNNVGRMGHGLGLQLTEPPSIMKKDKSVLEENMIITIEPSLEYSPGKMLVHEENVLITKGGYELLSSRTPKKLPIVK
jgi:Xaa-Pro aminopeptidase|tara:strand:- start:460 stop:1614 length:1155 start_codon:yes stop_codon:yes gene_type:complete